MYTAKNGILWVDDDVYFTGWSNGYKTRRQSLEKEKKTIETVGKGKGGRKGAITYETTYPDSDAYVYKYRFGRENRCLQPFEP